jgi:hypothetical protein
MNNQLKRNYLPLLTFLFLHVIEGESCRAASPFLENKPIEETSSQKIQEALYKKGKQKAGIGGFMATLGMALCYGRGYVSSTSFFECPPPPQNVFDILSLLITAGGGMLLGEGLREAREARKALAQLSHASGSVSGTKDIS